MNKLERKRTALKGRITSAKNAVDAHEITPLNIIEARNLLVRIEKLSSENDELYEQIVDLCTTDAEIVPHELHFANEDFRLQIMKNLMMEILEDLSPAPTPGSASGSSLSTSCGPTPSVTKDIRLPRLELPTFSGNRLDWLSFRDLFRAAVHDNHQLSGAQKLQYLKASVKGEAITLIQAFTLTDNNYDEAWKTLEARYQDARELINQNFDRLLSIPNLQGENPVILQKMFDRAKECFRAVEILHVSKETAYELILIHLLSKKLDSESRLQWERVLKKDALPSFQEFCDFGDHQARVTGAARSAVGTKKGQESRKQGTSVHHGSSASKSSPSSFSSKKASCSFCNEDHFMYSCRKFKALTTDDKWKFVKSKQLCFNCLSPRHRSDQCKSSHCRHCEKNHHSILHGGETSSSVLLAEQKPKAEELTVVNFATNTRAKGLLSTALIRVRDNSGEFLLCRALLDNGSESSFITSNCATRLGLRRRRVRVPLSGIASADAGTCKEMVELQFSSHFGFEPLFSAHGLILSTVTRDLPSVPVKMDSWQHISGLQLADPHFQEVGKIDVLLGADVFYALMEPGKKTGLPGEPIALKTALGWILGGNLFGSRLSDTISTFIVQCDLDSTLKKFWEQEETPRKTFRTAEEQICEEHYEATHSRDESGRFIVRLPLKEDGKQLGESREMAVRRFRSGERKNLADPIRHQTYRDVIEGYLKLGHMELIPEEEKTVPTSYYIPHHAVENPSSTTTPFRVVFDASSRSTTGVSLNQKMYVGPKLQDDLVCILIRFRKNKWAFTADIPKMYRQIAVHREHIDLQRIVWRDNPHEPIRDYRLLTVTFGTAAAPYLAIKSLQQLAKDEEKEFPRAAAMILRDFYVDDLMSGAQSEAEVIQLQKDLMQLLERGGMTLKKWSSNSPALMAAVPDDLKETTTPLTIEEDTSVKTLGLQWHPAADFFAFRVTLSSTTPTTKRTVLSEISKIFDPLGWLSPVIITAKIYMQKMWKEDLGWDQKLPLPLQQTWSDYRKQLPLIQTFKIPRFISQEKPVLQQLHGFCDASESAYAAVVFLRTVNAEGEVDVQMVAAKSKVAPVKQVSLPRLELCGTVLLVRLLQCVKEALDSPLDGTFGWTDSTIVLAWLASPPQKWKTYVANRVSEVQDVLPRDAWRHVKSEENPADCASRGIPPAELSTHHLWWKGPSWLSDPDLRQPSASEEVDGSIPEERSPVVLHMMKREDTFLHRYSSLSKLLRITSYCLRAIDWMRRKRTTRPQDLFKSTTVTTEEIHRALMTWIKQVQHSEFEDEIRSLKKGGCVFPGSRLSTLNPFIDKDVILRVGGRLQKSNLPWEGKHQILLPKKSFLTQLIIANQHDRDLHSGPQALLAALQQTYWIPTGRDVVRQFVRKCVKCCRFRAQTLYQQMGELPSARVTPAAPFQRTGVDYAGPFALTARRGRGQRSSKCYIALFVCFVTKAIHLELVSDLTTEAFLAALRRFISRRGKPTDLYSDNGSNFVGAKNSMEQHLALVTSATHNQKIQEELAADSISWHLQPPSGPHFGGMYESGVKSMKFHLKRVVGDTILTMEEMRTLLAQVEAVLNSRPITELSSDPADLQPLTPGHFLIGRPLTALAEPELTHLKESHLSRWQRVQQMFQHFWRRWSKEYLSRLQQRNKWLTPQDNVQTGTLVLLKDDNLPPAKWNLGRIIATHPGTDNLVRVVTVKTATSEFKRPITKLCILPIS